MDERLYADVTNASYFGNPPLLAHYTSIATLDAIVSNNELWFSNPLFMNDIEEVRGGIREGLEAYYYHEEINSALVTEVTQQQFRGLLEDCVRNFEVNHLFDTYIFCLSEHDPADEDGLLSMWRGYGDGGKGVALVLDGSPMKEVPGSPLIVDRVHYLSASERRAWFNAQANLFANVVLDKQVKGEELRYAVEALFGRLRLASLFSKHAGFHEEKEWRIAYLPERDHGGLLKKYRGYLVTNRGVEPKLKLKIAPIVGAVDNAVSLEALVQTILLGPSLQAPLLHQSVRRMLELKNRQDLAERVKASRIPFRPAGLQF
ncbi:DUF2971 domain-containing protein [Devosia sp. CN2-171]|uniref:DUF2971 domain-containing protein n=1 Tax=Devosia sp. CN2-171 TaxID=3400909 RepID=UPI003BF8C6BE